MTDAGREAAAAFHAEITEQLAKLTDSLDPADGEHMRATMAGIIRQHRMAAGTGTTVAC